MKKVIFKKNNGFFPDYTNDGVTIKKNWETLDREADLDIHENLVEFSKDGDLNKSIERFIKVHFNFPDSDVTKEATNPYIDFLIDFSDKSEEEIMDLYWSTYETIIQN